MQLYAEEAVEAHMANMQEEFFEQAKDNKNAPFVNISQAETDRILKKAMKASARWNIMESNDKSEEEIIASFKQKTKMKVFTWKGERDTIMTPLDSIRYYKHFLQSGLMAMEPQTGNIKAWVGGINYKYFRNEYSPLSFIKSLNYAENIIAKQIDEALGDLLNTITETFPSFAPEFQNIFLSVLKTVEPIAIKHNASVDIQNSMSILEESIVQFIDLANKNSIKFDNDNFSVAIPFDVVDLKISEHDPKNEILDQDIAQQDIISDAPNDESSDTIITPDTIDDINIVDTDIDLESKSEHNLELLKPESETLIEIVLSDQDITQGNLTIEVETNNLEAMPEHTLELQGITAENIEAIIHIFQCY
jgi:hypothetical protein